MQLKTELLPHQRTAVEKLSKIKIGALYMEMGTGKTRTALELINQRLEAGKVDFVLWLCPCSVKETIVAEIRKHTTENEFFRIEGIESLSSSIKLNSDLLELVQVKKCYLIVDESNLVKNHKAKRSKNIERLAEFCQYKLILNGTPISKCEKDLFMQWYILDWRILGYKSFWSFAANHLEYDDKGRIRRCLNVEYLVRKIAPYTYQVKKDECLTLPHKKYSLEYCHLTDEQEEHYDGISDIFLKQVDELYPTTIYKLFTALQHVISGNRVITSPNKSIKTMPFFYKPLENPRILKLLSLIKDEKYIIWCKYTSEIKIIAKILRGLYGQESVCEFYGEISKKNRQESIFRFKNESKFFIGNKTCAGYGLNLQFCNNVIYYSNDWDLATRLQSEDRVHRLGQENQVNINDIIASETLDNRILKCLRRKEMLVDSFKTEIERNKNKDNLKRWINGAEDA